MTVHLPMVGFAYGILGLSCIPTFSAKENKKEGWRRDFTSDVDANKDGYFSLEDMKLYKSRRPDWVDWVLEEPVLSENKWDVITRVPDTDKDGKLNIEEFVAAYVPDVDQRINQTFAMADKNSDGNIIATEMTNIVRGLSAEQMAMLIRSMDIDGDGKVNSTEFMRMVESGEKIDTTWRGKHKNWPADKISRLRKLQAEDKPRQHFRAFDEDRDTFISLPEFLHFVHYFIPMRLCERRGWEICGVNGRGGVIEPGRYNIPKPEIGRTSFGRSWQFYDFNKNREREEGTQYYTDYMKEIFTAADTNSDEKLTYAEFVDSTIMNMELKNKKNVHHSFSQYEIPHKFSGRTLLDDDGRQSLLSCSINYY